MAALLLLFRPWSLRQALLTRIHKTCFLLEARPTLWSVLVAVKQLTHHVGSASPVVSVTIFWLEVSDWVCIAPDTLVCLECEAKKRPPLPDSESPAHMLNHPLIRLHDCSIPQSSDATDSQVDLQTRLSALESLVEQRLSALEASVADRFSLFENLLRQIAGNTPGIP